MIIFLSTKKICPYSWRKTQTVWNKSYDAKILRKKTKTKRPQADFSIWNPRKMDYDKHFYCTAFAYY